MISTDKIASVAFILIGIALIMQAAAIFYFINKIMIPLQDLTNYITANVLSNASVAVSVPDFTIFSTTGWIYLFALLVASIFSLMTGFVLIFQKG